MADWGKVIKGLEACLDGGVCVECPYCETCSDGEDFVELARDALELLKAQEPVKPRYEDFFGVRVAICGNCNGYIVKYKYCPGCGRKVDWGD